LHVEEDKGGHGFLVQLLEGERVVVDVAVPEDRGDIALGFGFFVDVVGGYCRAGALQSGVVCIDKVLGAWLSFSFGWI